MNRLSIGLAAVAALALVPACDDSDTIDDQAPVAVDDTAVMNEDGVYLLDVLANDSDPDGDALQLVSASSDWGKTSIVGRQIRVQPGPDFNGKIKVIYTVSDSVLYAQGHASVTVVAVPDAPTAESISLVEIPPSGVRVELRGGDVDGDPVRYFILTEPDHGVLTGTPPSMYYTPSPGYDGSDSFRYQVSDGTSHTEATASLRTQRSDQIQVTPRNSLITTAEDTAVAFGFDYDDPHNVVWKYAVEIVTLPQHGSYASFGELKGHYTPNTDSNGVDTLTYRFRRKSDGAMTDPATVTFAVNAIDDLPVAQARPLTVDEDLGGGVTLAGTDVDSGPVTFRVKTPPAHGTVDLQGAVATYKPSPNYNGSDFFDYVAVAGDQDSAPARVSVTVRAINDAPVASDATLTTSEDTPATITLPGSDIDGPWVLYGQDVRPTHGTFSISDNVGTYRPVRNYFGPDELVFHITDGTSTATAKITITVESVNDAPQVNEDIAQVAVDGDGVISVLFNDTDVEDQRPGQIGAVSAPAHGTATASSDGTITYHAAGGFSGTDTFTYEAVDSDGGKTAATVRVGVGMFPGAVPVEFTPGGAQEAEPSAPSVSRDGRLIVFETKSSLLPADTNLVADVYLYDRLTRSTELISAPLTGQVSDGASTSAFISADGKRVAFTSASTRLVAGDSNGVADVFVYDRTGGTTRRVSVAPDGGQANGASRSAGISDDGERVVFTSDAFNLGERDANGASDVFVRDLGRSATLRMSLTATGGETDGPSTQAVISGDGKWVAFASTATNIVAGDSNDVSDVFVHEVNSGAISRVSVRSGVDGEQGNQASTAPSISADGTFVSFLSAATNLGTTGDTSVHAFVRDRSQSTTLLGIAKGSLRFAHLSADGRYLAAASYSGTWVRDRFGNETRPYFEDSSQPNFSFKITADGRYVLFLIRNGQRYSVYEAPSPLSPL